MDEIGVPFALTVDFNTVGYEGYDKDGCVTLRERDSQQQLRIPLLAAPGVVNGLVRGHLKFESLLAKYELVGGSAAQVNATLCGGGSEETSKAVVVESASPNGASLRFQQTCHSCQKLKNISVLLVYRQAGLDINCAILQICMRDLQIVHQHHSAVYIYIIEEDSSNCFLRDRIKCCVEI